MASLKLNGVDKVYPSGTLALYDINLEAKDKEFIVIVGAENSGKSTLLRVVAGLDDVSSGAISVGDKDVTDADPKDRDIAMVFKSSTLYPALTVFDNMAFGLRLRKAPQALIEQRVKSAAEILGITDVLFRKPKTLSSVQKQRVAIGRAIVREPRLYLFDEPLSGLDDKLQAEMLNVIINLQARMEGTFVYATKSVAEAMTIGTRIVVLKNGITQQVDTPSNLYDYPANSYVAFYIGSPTINFINKAKIVKEDDGVYAVDGELKLKLSEKIISRFENIKEYENTDKTVIIGVRPEDAALTSEGLDCTVGKVENDGASVYAECSVAGHDLVVTAGVEDKKGDNSKLDIDLDRLYLFDGETRLTLLSRDSGYTKTGYPEADVKPLTHAEEEEVIEKFKPKKDDKKKKR